jgi:hypothetical protein
VLAHAMTHNWGEKWFNIQLKKLMTLETFMLKDK